jgi:hypothetical protein
MIVLTRERTSRFRNVAAGDPGGAVEVGDRARHPEHPVVAARGQMHALGRAQQQLAAGRVGGRDPVEELALHLGVGAQLGLAELGEAVGLEPNESRAQNLPAAVNRGLWRDTASGLHNQPARRPRVQI